MYSLLFYCFAMCFFLKKKNTNTMPEHICFWKRYIKCIRLLQKNAVWVFGQAKSIIGLYHYSYLSFLSRTTGGPPPPSNSPIHPPTHLPTNQGYSYVSYIFYNLISSRMTRNFLKLIFVDFSKEFCGFY